MSFSMRADCELLRLLSKLAQLREQPLEVELDRDMARCGGA